MKLIFIYGPPAAGKFTVAKEVAALMGFRVMRNHIFVDAIKPIFEFASPPFFRIYSLMRNAFLTEAVREGRDGLIHTFCYAKTEDDATVQEVIDIVESNGGEVCFVQIICDEDTVLQRVTNDSRKEFGKIADAETLKGLLSRHELFAPVPMRESLAIDSRAVSAKESADLIVNHYKLQKR